MTKYSIQNILSNLLNKLKNFFCKSTFNATKTIQDCVKKALSNLSPENVSVNLLSWRDIIEWFQQWMNKPENVNKNVIGFTINEVFETGNYIIVQGVFNQTCNNVEDVRRITSKDVDEEVKHNCFREKVTLFT